MCGAVRACAQYRRYGCNASQYIVYSMCVRAFVCVYARTPGYLGTETAKQCVGPALRCVQTSSSSSSTTARFRVRDTNYVCIFIPAGHVCAHSLRIPPHAPLDKRPPAVRGTGAIFMVHRPSFEDVSHTHTARDSVLFFVHPAIDSDSASASQTRHMRVGARRPLTFSLNFRKR